MDQRVRSNVRKGPTVREWGGGAVGTRSVSEGSDEVEGSTTLFLSQFNEVYRTEGARKTNAQPETRAGSEGTKDTIKGVVTKAKTNKAIKGTARRNKRGRLKG